MKLKLALATLACVSSLLADMIVSPAALPQNAQAFLQANFPSTPVALVKQDVDSFDVTLQDGTEIDFIINGEWKEVDGKYKPIPTNFLSENLTARVKAAQPNAAIIEVSKKINGYKFKFSNRMEVYTDMNGNILGQKFDD